MKILVTGATGFLGSKIAALLVRRGHEVRALVRKNSDKKRLESLTLELREGDVTDRASIARAIEGAEAAFHSAAIYEIGATDEQKMRAVNVEGTRNVLEAAKAEGALVVHVSSTVALGPTGPEPRDEAHWNPIAPSSPYARTKREAHELAVRFAREGSRVRIAVPPTIYGPGDPSLVGKVHEWGTRGLIRVGALGGMKMALVHVDDCAEGVVRIAEAGLDGESYILAGPAVTVREWLTTLARVTRRRAPRFFLPDSLVRKGARLAELAAPLAGVKREVVREGLALSTAHWAFSAERARRELGFTARTLEAGLAETVRNREKHEEANMVGVSFREVMEGTLTRPGERFDRAFRFEFDIECPNVAGFVAGREAETAGTVTLDGLAKDVFARGTFELSPFRKKMMRYTFDFPGNDGRTYRFDGRKHIRWLDAVRTWTTLGGIVYDPDGKIWGTAILRFEKKNLRPLLRSIKLGRRGQPARKPEKQRAGPAAQPVGARSR